MWDNGYNKSIANQISDINYKNVAYYKKNHMSGGDLGSTLEDLAPLALLALGKPNGRRSGNMDTGGFQGKTVKKNSKEYIISNMEGLAKKRKSRKTGKGEIADIAHGVGDVAHGIGHAFDWLGIGKKKRKGRGESAAGYSGAGISASGMSGARHVGGGISASGMSGARRVGGGISASGKPRAKRVGGVSLVTTQDMPYSSMAGMAKKKKAPSAWSELIKKVGREHPNIGGLKKIIEFIGAHKLYHKK